MGFFKVGAWATNSNPGVGDFFNVEIRDRWFTAVEHQDLIDNDTYSELEHPIINLPLKSWYYDNSSNAVTTNIGTLGSAVTLGDGTSTDTFPTQLSPNGMSFDGSTDYIKVSDTGFNLSAGGTLSCGFRSDSIASTDVLISNSTGSLARFILSITGGEVIGSYYNGTAFGFKAPLIDNGFHTVSVSWDGTATNFYFDSILQTTAVVGTPAVATAGTYVGMRTDTQAKWQGNIYNPKIMDFAITASQARKLHHDMIQRLNI